MKKNFITKAAAITLTTAVILASTAGVRAEESKLQIGDTGKTVSVISNLKELKLWLWKTENYEVIGDYGAVTVFKNALGGEGIELKPGSKTRQCFIIKGNLAERLEKAGNTKFYRAAHYREPFPRDFDYLGICDYKAKTLLLVANPFKEAQK